MDFAYIVAGYYLLFCAAVIGLILRLMRNCPLDDEEEFSMGQGLASPVASSDRATCPTLNRSGKV